MRGAVLRLACATLLGATTALSGCAVLAVTGAVVGVAATGVGLATDVAVGAVRVTGKALGAAVDAVKPAQPPAP